MLEPTRGCQAGIKQRGVCPVGNTGNREIKSGNETIGNVAANDLMVVLLSSRGGTRTPDPVINSHLLYQLSYSGRHAS